MSRKERKAAAKNAGKGEREEKQEDLQLNLFTERAPWVMTTPQTRVARKTEGLEGDIGLPPPPQLPPPPAAPVDMKAESFGEEETRVMKTLQELKSMGVALSLEQQQKLEELEVRSKESQQQKALSHGHINRMDKAQNKLNAALLKIRNLDSEWKKFIQGTTVKVMNHAKLYQECRSQMCTLYLQRQEELNVIRKETQEASMSLIREAGNVTDITDSIDVEQDIQKLQQIFKEAAAGEVLEVLSDDEEMVPGEAMPDGNHQGVVKPGARKPQTFRGSPSPGKVANLNLKPKKETGEKDKWILLTADQCIFPWCRPSLASALDL